MPETKTTMWDSFGDIILENIRRNIPNNTKLCEVCGERFEYNERDNKSTMCRKCYILKRKYDVNNNVKKLYHKKITKIFGLIKINLIYFYESIDYQRLQAHLSIINSLSQIDS